MMHDIVDQTIWKVHGYQGPCPIGPLYCKVILGALLGHQKVHAVRPLSANPIAVYHLQRASQIYRCLV